MIVTVVLVRIQAGLVAVAMCAAMGSCARTPAEPGTRRSLEPSITQSSPMPTADTNNVACNLLTADERSAVAGYSLNAEMPVRPAPGTDECIWVQSLRRPARAAIRVVANSTPVWLRQLAPQLRAAIASPHTDKKLAAKLEDALTDVLADPQGLSDDEACATYVLLAESRGALLGVDQVFYSTIGALPAAFAVTCADGIMVVAGYGEYGVRPSLALNRAVTRLAGAASERAAETLEGGDARKPGDSPEGETDRNPEPSSTEADQGEAETDEGDTETDSAGADSDVQEEDDS